MTAVLTLDRRTSPGFQARSLRISLLLTQQELANMAGVSQKEVGLFENNWPVQLDIKRKLLRELWVRKASRAE